MANIVNTVTMFDFKHAEMQWKQKTDEEKYKELLKGWTDIQQHFREEILVNSWLVLFGRTEVNGVLEEFSIRVWWWI